MIDHTGITVSRCRRGEARSTPPRSRRSAITMLMEFEESAGFGIARSPTSGSAKARRRRCRRPRRVRARRGRGRRFTGGDGGGRHATTARRAAAPLSPQLLRRVRARPGRPQRRGGLSCAGVTADRPSGVMFNSRDGSMFMHPAPRAVAIALAWHRSRPRRRGPIRPIKFIMTAPAGSSIDTLGRAIAEKLTRGWVSRWSSRTSPRPAAPSPPPRSREPRRTATRCCSAIPARSRSRRCCRSCPTTCRRISRRSSPRRTSRRCSP